MFTIKGFREDGTRIQLAHEQPAFYGLFFRKTCLGYFISLEAARLASEDYTSYPESLEGL